MNVLSRSLCSLYLLAGVILLPSLNVQAESLLLEAESFDNHGGWGLDTQFIEIMGSPYLLAHGLGRPVEDAATKVQIPVSGTYQVYVRTKDWVAQWKAKGEPPGQFQVLVNGKPLATTFGTTGAEWNWQNGGKVELAAGEMDLRLHDLTGFDGRCDAIWLTNDLSAKPPEESAQLSSWRKKQLGLPEAPEEMGPFDLVVIGGGYSGLGSAIAAARMGIKVALIQNRPVLGGNGSSEIRVWAQGLVRRGEYPHIGEIIDEITDHATKSPGTYEEFGDEKKLAVVQAEPNISLFLNHHAFKVDKDGKKITAVYAFDTRTSAVRRFSAPLFSDCTGHGTIGYLADADYDIFDGVRMGMSNMWAWEETDAPQAFPQTPWALELNMADFPYPRDFHGQWFWESGFEKDSINDLEKIRDWNLRAVYGAWNAMKNKDGAADHRNARLTWLAYIGGPRESRRLMGDVILTEEDIVSKKQFPDGMVPSTWSIDLHYPKRQYMQKYPDNPFISVAEHGEGVDKRYGYPVPYRCFYSRNLDNLFMAGRCISVTHEALGTVRVMRTCGMMGEVVGKAASVCIKHGCTPREVYESYLEQLKELARLPGVTRRDDVDGPFYVRDGDETPESNSPYVNAKSLDGIVIDDKQAKLTGTWAAGTGLKPFIEESYLYGRGGSAVFPFEVKESGRYDVRFAMGKHENRATNVPVTVVHANGEEKIVINQQETGPIKPCFLSLGTFQFEAGQKYEVKVDASNVNGNCHLDAVWLAPVK
ncbi:MAG: FAD-dependent oxidoreductase [Planctomycetaceae bacterium]|nr:FAD-dependent oxidoreductase [Planctomycetaceae bacterium]